MVKYATNQLISSAYIFTINNTINILVIYIHHYGYGCCTQQTNSCGNNFGGYGYALILVLFILLVIIGTARW